MKQIISNHNKTILNKDNNTESKTNNCNCRIKEACPVNQKCQTSSLIYQATVTRHDNNKEESYIGLTDNTFKTRLTDTQAASEMSNIGMQQPLVITYGH